MKKLIVGFFALAVLASCNNNKGASASTEVNSKENSTTGMSGTAPVMKFEKDVYEFGKIKQGQSVSYDFIFTNTGKTPLIIKDAVATCGCTVPEPPSEPIAPGATSKIKVVFNSAGKEGLQDKVVTITANTIPAQTQIHLIGEVTK